MGEVCTLKLQSERWEQANTDVNTHLETLKQFEVLHTSLPFKLYLEKKIVQDPCWAHLSVFIHYCNLTSTCWFPDCKGFNAYITPAGHPKSECTSALLLALCQSVASTETAWTILVQCLMERQGKLCSRVTLCRLSIHHSGLLFKGLGMHRDKQTNY